MMLDLGLAVDLSVFKTDRTKSSSSLVYRMLTTTARPLASRLGDIYAKEDLRKKMEAYRRARSERERRELIDGVFVLRRKAGSQTEVYTTSLEDADTSDRSWSQQWPCHRSRKYSTEPDSEGWRTVIKHYHVRRHLTDEELEEKYAVLGDVPLSDEEEAHGELADGYRRAFY
jgi:hypothetical protein